MFEELAGRTGENVRVEECIQHTDGTVRWLSATITNHLGTPGIEGFVVNCPRHDGVTPGPAAPA